MTNYPCDTDPDDPGPDLVDLLARSIALAKGERHLNAIRYDINPVPPGYYPPGYTPGMHMHRVPKEPT